MKDNHAVPDLDTILIYLTSFQPQHWLPETFTWQMKQAMVT
jgi:hypothetical protein